MKKRLAILFASLALLPCLSNATQFETEDENQTTGGTHQYNVEQEEDQCCGSFLKTVRTSWTKYQGWRDENYYRGGRPRNITSFLGEDEQTICCFTITTLKEYGLVELGRNYPKKSTWVQTRDFTEEILNRTLFGPIYWPFGIRVL